MSHTSSETGTARAVDTAAPAKLARSITGPLLFLFILGDVLGAGIYALMGVLSDEVGGVLWAPLVIALLMALLTAGSYAELVTKYPRAGGAAVFANRAFGKPLLSFLVGFSMLAAGVTSAAGLALAFSGDYLATFVDVPVVPAALVFLVLVACLNARGISESLKTNVVMTVIELTGLLIVIAVVAVMLGRGDGDVGRVVEFPDGSPPALAILGGAIIAYYSFVGFETSANVVEEIKDPSRVYPRALFGALITAGVMYALVGLASAIALPPEELSESSGPLLAVVGASGAGIPDWVFSLIALIAVANGALLTMIMSSRLTYGMAEQGLLPGVLTRVAQPPHPVGGDRRHHSGRDAADPRRRSVDAGPDGGAAAAVRLPVHQRRCAGAAPRPRRASAFPGVDVRPGPRCRVVRAAVDPAECDGVAVRRCAAGGRCRAVRGGAHGGPSPQW